jgi:type VI secretion system secreted protein Hcp
MESQVVRVFQRVLHRALRRAATVALLAGVLVGGWTAQAAADEIYVTIQGQKQGHFPGDATAKQHLGKIRASGFGAGVTSPRDVGTGQASGKRQHKPITITKALGVSSPQILNALVTNENLLSVVIEFVRPTKGGGTEVYYTVKLSNAFITEISQNAAPNDASKADGDVVVSESLAFVFQKIEVTSKDGNANAADDVSGTL